MFKRLLSFTLVIIAAGLLFSANVRAQGTAFTYQGKLTDGVNQANGPYDFQFTLFDALSGGTQQGSTVTVTNVIVTAGIFTAQLDFGACASCFDGSPRFLEIAVKKTIDSTYSTLSPRQQVTSNPYAIRSLNATTADGLGILCVSCITSSQIQSVQGSQVNGEIPVASVPAGNGSYIQNQSGLAQSASFKISGTGAASIFDAVTQYNLGGQRILSAAGTNLSAGLGASSVIFGSQNAFFGVNAGSAFTFGCCNSFFGFNAGHLNSTGDNSFFGNNSGAANTTGARNSFFGSVSGFSNVSGSDNAFFGVNAGRNNTASSNTFAGSSAGYNNTTGDGNAFFGASAGLNSTTGSRNSFVGTAAGSLNNTENDNVFIGFDAGVRNGSNDTNSLANSNTFVGSFAGSGNTTGGLNTFIGSRTGGSNTTGVYNTFVGSSAGFNNTTGGYNSFFGEGAGGQNSTAFGNTFFGAQSGQTNTTGMRNAFFGSTAGQNNTTQHDNTFLGSDAGLLNGADDTAGNANLNTFVGSSAGENSEIGSNNTIIGAYADVGANNLANATALGARALVSSSNSLVLGSINGLNSSTSDTKVGIGTPTPGYKLHIAGHTNSDWPIIKLQNVDSGGHAYWLYAGAGGTATDFGIYDETVNAYRLYINGSNGNVGINITPVDRLDVFGNIRIGTINGCVIDRLGNVIAGACGSDARLKRDITPFPRLLEKIAQLQPVHFYWRTEQFPERHFGPSQSFGLVAQEVEKVIPELVSEDEQGYKVVLYNKLPLLMLQAIKELKEANDSLKQENRRLQSQMDGLKKLVCVDHPNADICKQDVKP